MRIDFGDLLIFFGAIMFLAGLYLLDWRLALVAGGILLMVLGSLRLRVTSNNERT